MLLTRLVKLRVEVHSARTANKTFHVLVVHRGAGADDVIVGSSQKLIGPLAADQEVASSHAKQHVVAVAGGPAAGAILLSRGFQLDSADLTTIDQTALAVCRSRRSGQIQSLRDWRRRAKVNVARCPGRELAGLSWRKTVTTIMVRQALSQYGKMSVMDAIARKTRKR
jgi:hypothetical protein